MGDGLRALADLAMIAATGSAAPPAHQHIDDPSRLPHNVAFDSGLALLVRLACLALTGALYAATVLRHAGTSTSAYKLELFFALATAIPIAAAYSLRCSGLILSSFSIIIFVAALSFDTAALLTHAFSDIRTWNTIVHALLPILTAIHLAMLISIAISPSVMRSYVLPRWTAIITFRGAISEPVTLTCLLSASMLIVFRVEPTNPLLNVALSGIFELSPKPHWTLLIGAPVIAVLILLACFMLIRWETGCASNDPDRLRRIETAILAFTIPASFAWYFDFAFHTDVLHFLTNVGPAAQIVHAGSVPMVTAFSQYGPGPLIATWLSFLILTPSFQAANVLSQFNSLAFYAAILLCLYRMTPHRLPALLLGLAAIGVVMAGWWGGNSSLNTVPSAMGLRYLPNALLVLAISFLGKNRCNSLGVFASVMLAALWSYETLLGSLAIVGLFLLMLRLRNRDLPGLIRDSVVAIFLPVAAAFALMSALTLLWSGAWPNYHAYLRFALVYNMVSDFWSLPGDGSFFGWIAVATPGMTALALCWSSALRYRIPWDSDVLIYRFAPMAGLVAFMSSYFVGRSVDFTLIICFLPLAALTIPAILAVFKRAILGHRSAVYLAAVACAIIFLPLTSSIAALYRAGSPYAVAITECLHQGTCTPRKYLELARSRYHSRPMLDQSADPTYFDQGGLTTEALDLIAEYAAGRDRIALFLGIHPRTIWSVHTNAVLVLAEKGHKWPLSYVLTDEINPMLRRAIVQADVILDEGEPIFIRRDEGRLGDLEAAIVKKIRNEVRLCPVRTNKMVSVYRVTHQADC